ncbi:Uncharacterised protein [Mycobacteroides abscessus subsp. abscessus]|nr:Uncharacterised protein [Mycobacteroides abscessus subsp. abscessus]
MHRVADQVEAGEQGAAQQVLELVAHQPHLVLRAVESDRNDRRRISGKRFLRFSATLSQNCQPPLGDRIERIEVRAAERICQHVTHGQQIEFVAADLGRAQRCQHRGVGAGADHRSGRAGGAQIQHHDRALAQRSLRGLQPAGGRRGLGHQRDLAQPGRLQRRALHLDGVQRPPRGMAGHHGARAGAGGGAHLVDQAADRGGHQILCRVRRTVLGQDVHRIADAG